MEKIKEKIENISLPTPILRLMQALEDA